ncbi:MAG: hypothetical protein H6850_03925 [Alphaproteobacteria bacterium]|nr:MAG: hypothetical protein H6850_03925 [Alphaproteobacteria bacterium]
MPYLLLLKMSLDDWKTHQIDMFDLLLFSTCALSCWTAGAFLAGYTFRKYWQAGDIVLFSLMCAYPSIYISQFFILAGLIGIFMHLIMRKRHIPFVPVLAIAFYFSSVI